MTRDLTREEVMFWFSKATSFTIDADKGIKIELKSKHNIMTIINNGR